MLPCVSFSLQYILVLSRIIVCFEHLNVPDEGYSRNVPCALTLSHSVVSSTHCLREIPYYNVSGDSH